MSRSVAEWIGRTDDSMPSQATRDRISRGQGDCCAHCRRRFGPKLRPHCDHVIPLRDGGQNRESNMQMLCEDCHKAKTQAENSGRAKVTRIRAKHLGLDRAILRPKPRWGSRPLGNGNHQHTATRPRAKAIGQFGDAK